MRKPRRIRLSRAKGFNLQAESRKLNGLPAVKVDRSTPWGNPFIVGKHAGRMECARLLRVLAGGYACLSAGPPALEQQGWYEYMRLHIHQLRGKNLACWCPLDAPCHADALIEIANREPTA